MRRFCLHLLILGSIIFSTFAGLRGEESIEFQSTEEQAHETFKANNNDWTTSLPDFERIEGGRYAVALFVTEQGSQTPIQATGTWLTKE
ncbi:MAG: hypothetical protein O3C43_05515 [Verrucomicrobia bacterium]|nr:hypothetical protein [Verrucomicrobiota bacterium]MDA1065941.1 hypothetical protein [Verrucomicrobiota bacterium]